MTKFQFRNSSAFLFVPLFVYLIFSLWSLGLPGLHYDEVLFANAALGNLEGSFVAWKTTIMGHHLPVMLMPYLGALKAYLYYPLFKVCTPGVLTVRLPVILLGLISLLFNYSAVRRMFGPCTGLWSVMLLASDPTFIFMHKADWGPFAIMMLLKVASLTCIVHWLKNGRTVWLGLAFFFMGIGVFDKLIFLWYVAALVFSLPICFWPLLKERLTLRGAASALFCFLAGCFPFLVYLIRTQGESLANPNQFHLSGLQDFMLRCSVMTGTLNGTAVENFFNNEFLQNLAPLLRSQNGAGVENALAGAENSFAPSGTFLTFALLSALLGLGFLRKTGRLQLQSYVLFCLLIPIWMTAMIFMTPGATGIQHFAILYPFPQILIAAALCQSNSLNPLHRLGSVPAGRLIAMALGLVLVISQIYADVRYLHSLSRTGGVGIWSDAIYRLSEFVKTHSNKTYALMDWGFSNQLLVLTEGRIREQESFQAIKDSRGEAERFDRLRELLQRPDTFFVFHAKKFEVFPMLDPFNEALQKCGRKAQPIQTFYQRNGEPVYLLFQVLPE